MEKCSNITFVDALLTSTSAVSVVGLTSVDLSTFCVTSQFFVMVLIMLGGHVLMSLAPLMLRQYYYKKYVEVRMDNHLLRRKINSI